MDMVLYRRRYDFRTSLDVKIEKKKTLSKEKSSRKHENHSVVCLRWGKSFDTFVIYLQYVPELIFLFPFKKKCLLIPAEIAFGM